MTISPDFTIDDRRAWMAVLARAGAGPLRDALATIPTLPAWQRLRGPETGLIMLRGRAGGDGAAFNLMETTATRCTVTMQGGAMGHATILGRDPEHAELAAAIDAGLQLPALRAALLRHAVEPLAEAQCRERDIKARRAAATRVQFFTLAAMR
ncbi:MAG: phosphonate C-P lyase system protein PhnG [Alphaproteobacteria bacterium]|nr:phosphonate C-P lyase system protein PhnG [Alphaproteobacteria bacterium]